MTWHAISASDLRYPIYSTAISSLFFPAVSSYQNGKNNECIFMQQLVKLSRNFCNLHPFPCSLGKADAEVDDVADPGVCGGGIPKFKIR